MNNINKKNNTEKKLEENILEYSQNNIIHFGYFSANKIIYSLYRKIPETLKILKENNVKLNFLLNYGNIFSGYMGNLLKIDEVYTGSIMKETETFLLSLNAVYSNLNLFIHQNCINNLDSKLLEYTYPCEIIKHSNTDIGVNKSNLNNSFNSQHNSKYNSNNSDYNLMPTSHLLTIITKQFYNFPFYNSDLFPVYDNEIEIIKNEIIKERKNNSETFAVLNERIADFIQADLDYAQYSMKKAPSDLIKNVKILFENFQDSRYNECIVHMRKIKKKKDFKQASADFKKRFTNLEEIVKEKIKTSRKKSQIKKEHKESENKILNENEGNKESENKSGNKSEIESNTNTEIQNFTMVV